MSIFTAVVVSLSQATLCFAGACHPALVGVDTPTGQYRITHVATNEPGYSGDVLMFKENKHYVWAIHRLWLLDPKQQRAKRIDSNNPHERVITMGCINLKDATYASLVSWLEKHPGAQLEIKK